jgi:hypothetical protein
MTNHEFQIVFVLLFLITAGVFGHLLLNDNSRISTGDHNLAALTISGSDSKSKTVASEAIGAASQVNKCEFKNPRRASDLYNLRLDIDQHVYVQVARNMIKSSGTDNLIN